MNRTHKLTENFNGTADDCRSPMTVQLVDYWRHKQPTPDALPRWRDINLMDLHKIASSMAVKDVIGNGEDFVNRFWGTQLTLHLGFEGTGVLVSDYQPVRMRKALLKRCSTVYKSGQASMVRGQIATIPDKTYLKFELVHLPLWGARDQVEHIISVCDFGFSLPEDQTEIETLEGHGK